MAFVVVMPRRGNFVTSGLLSEWLCREGEPVKKGQALFTFETDKAEFTEEAPADGILLKIFCHEDEDVPCLEPIGVIGAVGEDYTAAVETARAVARGETPEESAPEATAALAPAPAPAVEPEKPERVAVSPRARAVAQALGVNPEQAVPTGPYGLIIERDVRALAAAQAPAAVPVEAGRTEPLSGIRKRIARSMRESLQNTAQLTNSTSFDATTLLSCHKRLKQSTAAQKQGLKISINDLILYAVAKTLPDFPALNAHCKDDQVTYFDHVHLGIAVDTDRGLMVPTLRLAEEQSLATLSAAAKALAEQARGGSIDPDLLHGATFTVSNLGMYGMESFTPILNPPQTGILGVCGVTERVRTVDGVLRGYPAMGLSLTYDHQVVDGAYAARFLAALREQLEQIDVLLMLM